VDTPGCVDLCLSHLRLTLQTTVMAHWRNNPDWESQQLLLFAMPPILLGNILDIYYQLK
jgi:hypothetical protein